MQWTSCMNMTLRTQLKDVKVQCQKTFNDYFTRRSQLKEKLEVVEEKGQRIKSINYNFEWSSKFSQESCSSRNITCGGVHD